MRARAMRHGFAGNKWQMATTPSSNVSSNIANGSAEHAGKHFKTMECNVPAMPSEGAA
jgi:hypothetical protein